ncbi:MAG: L-idonate 5-dehydrogenase [Pseudomonadota bacterium]
MKALVIHEEKDLRIEDRDTGEPGSGQVRIRLAAGGICGSDLHYFNHGGFGTVRLKEPMILGHEVAGHVAELGEGVTGLAVGDLVAVSPSRPCGRCKYSLEGLPNHCENMRFYGSAMPFPHIQGAFRQELIADAAQCAPAGDLSPGEAAMAEPLSVVLHACKRAGDLFGKRVLVTGCGPIGTLAIVAARAAGAAEIVATDLSENALAFARKVGVDRAIDMSKDGDALTGYAAGKGTFDVLFECSGAAPALASGIAAMRPRGIVMQLGLGGDMMVPVQALTAKELDLRGSFRFHEEFFTAVQQMRSGRIDVKPLISHTLPMADALDAFALANDRSRAMKVQMDFA